MFLIPIFSFILIKSLFIHGEFFTSTTHLTQILNTEVELAKRLEIYLKEEYERLSHIEKFLNIINDEISQAQENEEYYFSNPINSHLFIKHLTTEWNNIGEMLPSNFVKTITDNWLFPSFEDYTGSALGLMRLQDIYNLNTSQLSNGEISSKFKSQTLSASECYDLGRVAYANDDFYHTLMWMQEALDHFEKEINKTSINRIDILEYLVNATAAQGNIEHALDITEQILVIVPDHVQAKTNKIYYESIIINRTLTKLQRKDNLNVNNSIDLKLISTTKKNKNYKIRNERSENYIGEHKLYEELCQQNGSLLYSKRQSKLFCRYRHNNHPYLILQPIKEEQLSIEPNIYLFHDIISNEDIEEIKSVASPKLHRGLIYDPTTNTFKTTDYRISKITWLDDKDSPAVARLSHLIEAVTNLSIITAEKLLIGNYGVGGQYEPHYDCSLEPDDNYSKPGFGNRIATWLVYLSNVEEGGATVFPISGDYLKPKKGSAVFWYNLHASGEVDYATLHAACPVLIGNKWIANKWLHERGQEFRRPCSLDQMD